MAAGSTRLRVRVSPGARETRIVGRHSSASKVRVAAPPERGFALLTDAGGRDKVIALDGRAADEAHRRLSDAAELRA